MVVGSFNGLGSNNIAKTDLGSSDSGQPVSIGTVDGIPLLESDYKKQLTQGEEIMQLRGQTVPLQEKPLMRSVVLDQMIGGALLETQASKYNVSVSDADVTAEQAKEVDQSGLAAKLSLDPKATVADIDASLTAKGQPTVSTLFPEDTIRHQLLQQKVKAAIDAQTVVTEANIGDYYKQWHTVHILIDNHKRSDAQALVQAQQVLAMVKAPGADFAALAKKYSDDPGSKNTGGEDHWIDRTTNYVQEFKTAAFALKPGEVTSTPVASPQFGYFIIKCLGTQVKLPADFAKNKASDIASAQEDEQKDNLKNIIAALRKDPSTKIVITDPRLIADQAMGSIPTLSDPGAVNEAYKTALSNYLVALNDKNISIEDKGDIDAAVAQIYEFQKNTPSELTYLKSAAEETRDAGLNLQLGQLYLQKVDLTNALAAFNTASTVAWNDPDIHYQLLSIYRGMKRDDLVKTESQWLATYTQQQKAQQAAQGQLGGGMSGLPPGVTVMPSSGGPQPPAQVVHTATPGAPAKPAQ
jgi:parvulin-like peptidyl-prolyl isomerase